MLSTISTIFALNKKLTLGLPSALTWVFLYNHEGPCGVILFSLEMMIIKKHLLSDFSSIWLSLPLWSFLDVQLDFLYFFGALLVNSSVLFVNHSTQQSSFYLLLDWASWGLFMAERSSTAHCTVCYSVDVLASSGHVNGCLSPQFVCPCCEIWTPIPGLETTGWGFNWVTSTVITMKEVKKVGKKIE